MPNELRDVLGRKIDPEELRPERKAERANPVDGEAPSWKDFCDDMERDLIEMTKENDPRWRNVFGEEVDLDNIDREYALNILLMVHARRVKMGYTRQDFMEDRLVQRLRGVVLDGREPNLHDKLRAKVYNVRTRRAGLPYRAGR